MLVSCEFYSKYILEIYISYLHQNNIKKTFILCVILISYIFFHITFFLTFKNYLIYDLKKFPFIIFSTYFCSVLKN